MIHIDNKLWNVPGGLGWEFMTFFFTGAAVAVADGLEGCCGRLLWAATTAGLGGAGVTANSQGNIIIIERLQITTLITQYMFCFDIMHSIYDSYEEINSQIGAKVFLNAVYYFKNKIAFAVLKKFISMTTIFFLNKNSLRW